MVTKPTEVPGQTAEIRADEPGKLRPVDVLIAILVLGSLWGVVEVVLGGALRAWGISYRAGILTGVGMGVMGAGLAVMFGVIRRPLTLIGIALVAVLCKQLVVPLLHVSLMCKANSCLAVVLQGSALAGVVTLAGRRFDKRYIVMAAGAASAALLARGVFYFAGMRLAPCAYLLSYNHAGGFVDYMAANGLAWAGFSALFLPMGYRAGSLLREPFLAVGLRKPALYYSSSLVAVVLCWAASAVAISAGF